MDKFCTMEIAPWGGGRIKEIVGYKNTNELDDIIKTNCVFFKRERDNEEIPSEIYVDFNKDKLYNKYKKDKVYEEISAPNAGVLRMRLRQICGGSLGEDIKLDIEKLQWLKEFLESIDTRVVIFYNFNSEGDSILKIANSLNKPVSIYNGTTKDISNFEKYDNSIIIVNYASGGTGINWLSKAYIGIFYTPPESYLLFEQSRKRLDRIGQTHKPLFYKLRTKYSVENAIYSSIERGEDFDERKFNEYLQSFED